MCCLYDFLKIGRAVLVAVSRYGRILLIKIFTNDSVLGCHTPYGNMLGSATYKKNCIKYSHISTFPDIQWVTGVPMPRSCFVIFFVFFPPRTFGQKLKSRQFSISEK